ncbi:DUF2993 domain-containing protein [Diaminobutyricimonas sp. TR449]|uniref:LmeA family phospholipid-binding protein n=1 Tax=Diaminobutyricimonas sp. TR449 TaxID=2708076 RepID=UPI001423B604|nr:DUF2993 domain-containing protein [Diaminobutyricimonas sp. TR449]
MTDAALPRRRRGRVIGWVLGLALLIVVLLVVADIGGRAFAENRAEQELQSRLPSGSSPAEVSIGGFSFLQQLIAGQFDRVDVSVAELVIAETSVGADLTGFGVPLDQSQPVSELTGQFTIDEAALNTALQARGFTGPVTLGEQQATYTTDVELFGQTVDLLVTLVPELEGDVVRLVPTSIESPDAGTSVALDQFLDPERLAIPFCVAEVLPEGVQVTGIEISGGVVRLDAEASDFPLNAAALSTTGTCG